MKRAVAAEGLHMLAGLVVTAAIFAAAAWSYPQGAGTIWWIGTATMAVVLAMSIAALRRAAGGSSHDG
jgi:hypothetical protein